MGRERTGNAKEGQRDEPSLIEAVRRDPPDEEALQELVDRHWRALVARCRLLTLDPEEARDLAQETWCRVLQARNTLRTDVNLAGYLSTVATNLWRDRMRARRRAGALAPDRLVSLDAPVGLGHVDSESFGATVQLPESADTERGTALRIDLDRALATLSPRAREVLLARYIGDESAADIARRFGRSEQTVTAWIRQATSVLLQVLDPHLSSEATEHAGPTAAASAMDSAGGAPGARA